MLASVLRAGARYFHCAMMNADQVACCCSEHEQAPSDEIRDRDCCERRNVDHLPDVVGMTPLAPQTSPLVATLPRPAGHLQATTVAVACLRINRARAAPPDPPTPVSLMVFLT